MPKNYTLDDILNEYSGEEKHKSAVKNKTAVKTEIKSNGQTGLLCRDIDRIFRFAALRPLIDERKLHRNGSVKVVEEVAPVLTTGGLVVCLCKLIVNIFKGDGL